MAFNATDEKERKVVNVGGEGTFLTLRVSSERKKRRLFLNYVRCVVSRKRYKKRQRVPLIRESNQRRTI